MHRFRIALILTYFAAASLPLLWLFLTSIKHEDHALTTWKPKLIPAIGVGIYGSIDFTVPERVVQNAERALQERKSKPTPEQGLRNEEHLEWARQLSGAEAPEPQNIRAIKAWFGESESGINRASTSWKNKGPDWQTWHGFGGNTGRDWIRKISQEMEVRDAAWDETVFYAPSLKGFTGLPKPITVGGPSFLMFLFNSIVIALFSTLAVVVMGTSTAYGFSRFKIAGSRDWLFFILSTRFLPPLAVVMPIFLMFNQFNLRNTHLGLIILYTAFNLSLSVWLMKGFIDEIPQAYEEAAMVDGYTRLQAFWKIVLPQARTGMAVTAVFCLISAWNEFGYAVVLNDNKAMTVPVFFAFLKDPGKPLPWAKVAACVLVFVVPIVIFTVLVRKHLLRGVTFGTIKQ